MPEKQDLSVSILAVGEFETDRPLLHEMARKHGWRLFEAADRRRAIQTLVRNAVHVVLAETGLPQWDWKSVLNDLRRLAHPPQLIVTSRTADDHLWAEVLNIGGYDVLPQPLERDEAERVIAAACRHCHLPASAGLHAAITAAIVA